MTTRNANAPLGAGAALDRIVALRDAEQRDIDEAVAVVRKRYADKRAKLYARVPDDLKPALDRMLQMVAAAIVDTETPAEPSGDIAPEAPSNGGTTAEEPGRDSNDRLQRLMTEEPEGEPPIVVERGERKTGARRGS